MEAPILFSPPDNTTPAPGDVFVTSVRGLPLAYWDSLDAVQGDTHLAFAWGDVQADLIAFLGGGYRTKASYAGPVGQATATNYQMPAGGLVTLPITLYPQASGSLAITGIGMLVDAPVSGQLIQLVDESGTVVASTTVNLASKSGYAQALSEPWIVPATGQTYTIRATLPNGVRVGQNTLNCGCGRGLSGLAGMGPFVAHGPAGGYVLNVATRCRYEVLVEQLMADERASIVIKWMTAYRTAVRMLSLPSSGQIERSTVMNDDEWKALVENYDAEYHNRLNWLKVENWNLDFANTCLATESKPNTARLGTLFRTSAPNR